MPRFRAITAAIAIALSCAMLPAAGPDAADAAYEAGRAALGRRDYPTAIMQLARAVELRPGFADAWFRLGIARSREREWEGAAEAYRRVLELEPGNARAYNNLANVHYRRGEIEQAAEAYRLALEKDPGYLLAAFHYGWMLRQLNRTEEAAEAFRRCLELPAETDRARKTHLDCLFYSGTLAQRTGDYPAAVRIMEQVLAAMPGHPEARYHLGIAYRHLGREEDARRQLEIHRRILQTIRESGPEMDHGEP